MSTGPHIRRVRQGDDADGRAFIRRFATWLRAGDDDGHLPWAPDSKTGLLAGSCVGIKAAGSIGELQSLNLSVDGDALDIARFVVLLFPEAVAFFVAQDRDCPMDWVGTRQQLFDSLHPLFAYRLTPEYPGYRDHTNFSEFGHVLRLPGIGRYPMLAFDGRLLSQE
jgi:hypothetical protein